MDAVFISGAAAGIGAATARRFAAAGWRVGIYDIDRAGAERLAATLVEEFGEGSARAGALDVTSADQWEAALADFTGTTEGRLDVLINNAGILRGGRFAELPLAAHHATIDVNVGGVINGCYAAHRYLAATSESMVVNLCSASAIYGQAELATYSASKFAIRGLTEALDLEWRKDGIRVEAVWPLFVATAMTDGLDIASTDTLGINLQPDDVAEEIFGVVRPRWRLGRVLPHSVHTAVGLPAKFFATTSNLMPSFLTREVNKRITRS
ncbi:SDR family oxidoreductase [Nocardioides sp.]|uniref:SDR family oxidoreductase n=1 Tax=Nocardioides sp. TaxID=35761 RepID=UPI00262E1269|nr:SDR family oxidoreductase [Nocardioides sp.]